MGNDGGDGAHAQLTHTAPPTPRPRPPPNRRAKDLVQSNIDVLHKTAEVLLEREQIDGEEFQRIVLESQAQQYLKQDEPSVAVPYR